MANSRIKHARRVMALAVVASVGIARGQVGNGSFETGVFSPEWIATDLTGPFFPLQVGVAGASSFPGFFLCDPTDGALAALSGWDGNGPGVIRLAQDVAVPSSATVLTFDYRAAWDLTFGATQDRRFSVIVEPNGGGVAQQTNDFLIATAGTTQLDSGPLTGLVDVTAFAGGTWRVVFEWFVPENFTGPAFFQLDHIRFDVGIPCSLPPEPANPDPADGATDVPLDADLAWGGAVAGGLLYAIRDSFDGTYVIDVHTGVPTLIGPSAVTSATCGLAHSGAALLYGSTWTQLSIIQVDGSGATAQGTQGMEGLAYDQATGTLYATLNGDFFTVDPATGNRLATLPFWDHDPEGLAFVPSVGTQGSVFGISGFDGFPPGVLSRYDVALNAFFTVGDTGLGNASIESGLAYAPDLDVLFHITKNTGDLYRIDKNTAVATFVANTGIADFDGFSGLAYGPGAAGLGPATGWTPAAVTGPVETSNGQVVNIPTPALGAPGPHGSSANRTNANTYGGAAWAAVSRTPEEREALAGLVRSGGNQQSGARPSVGPYPLSALEQVAGGTVHILMFDGFSDNFPGGESENTVNAIAEHFTDFSLTRTQTTDPTDLAGELLGQDVFLVPEQELADDQLALIGASWAGVLQDFVAAGGIVIFCEEWGPSDGFISATGLLHVSLVSQTSFDINVVVVEATHPITNGLPPSFLGADATGWYDVTDPDAVSLIEFKGSPVVAARDLGSGHVVLIGFDYYSYNTDMARVIANAVQWGNGGTGGCAVRYDVYLGTNDPPTALICDNVASPMCDPGTLAPETTYYWQVRGRNPAGTTLGPVWSFTTQGCDPPPAPASPDPVDGATDVPLDADLAWGGAVAGGLLYGSDPVANQLLTIDPATGLGTIIGPFAGAVGNVTEIEWSPDGGTLYATTGGGSSSILTIDPATGAVLTTEVHPFGAVNGLEFAANGDLLGTFIPGPGGPSELVRVDPDTGALTSIGPTGFSNIGGLAFHSGFGTLFGLTSGPSGPPVLLSLDVATGAATLIATTDLEVEASSLEFTAEGRLVTGGADGNFYELNSATGVSTLIGPMGVAKVSGLSVRPLGATQAPAPHGHPANRTKAYAYAVQAVTSDSTVPVVGVRAARTSFQGPPGLANVAIFQDQNPWGLTANEDTLTANGISFQVFGSGDMGSVNLAPFDKVVIASVQTPAFYDALEAQRSWFEDYVTAGGIVDLHLASFSSDSADGRVFPGGFSTGGQPGFDDVTVVDPAHAVLTTPHSISDAQLDGWNFSTHGYFVAAPAAAQEILEIAGSGEPCCMDLPFGAGRIFATVQTVEWSDALPAYLENTLLYSLTGGGGCRTTYDVYLGTDDPPTTLICDDVASPTCDPGTLAECASYYWQVCAASGTGEACGPVWTFTTEGDCDVDGLCAFADNCPTVTNPDQTDSDGDGFGDNCDRASDADHDGDVDLDDYASFRGCESGPGIPAGMACQADHDHDADTDVDLLDWSTLQAAFTGSIASPCD